MEHQNRHATSVIVLSYKQSRYLNALVHKLQHSARSRLFNDLFLPHGSPRTSFHLFAWSHGRRRRVWSLSLNSTTLLDSDWAVPAWCGHAAPVCCIQQDVQSKNPLRFVDISHRHSLNLCMDQNLKEDCWQAFQWTPFPKSELYLDESQFLFLQQVDHAIEETPATSKLPFDVLSLRQLSFLKSAWMSGLTCHECAKGIWTRSHAVLWSGSFHSSPNETAKLLTTLARFQGLTSICVPSRSPATKKWTESCSSTPFFGIACFLKYPRSPLNAPKSLILCSCVCNTNQSKAISRSRSTPL